MERTTCAFTLPAEQGIAPAWSAAHARYVRQQSAMAESDERFPQGVIQNGCERLGATLAKVPLVSDFSWSGIQHRYWWARFAIACDDPLAWGVIRRLAYCLNSSVLELWRAQPFVFKPEGEETLFHARRRDVIYWTIESTVPLLDPAEVADHLEMVLLSEIADEKDWLEY